MVKIKKNSLFLSFLAYCAVLFFIAFIGARQIGDFSVGESLQYFANVIPFATIVQYFTRFASGEIGLLPLFLNTLGHVVLMIPMGILLPSLFRRMRGFAPTVITACSVTFVLEFFQMLFKLGSFDIDSILLRGIGTAVGFIIWHAYHTEITE